jgi:hypothetical protein
MATPATPNWALAILVGLVVALLTPWIMGLIVVRRARQRRQNEIDQEVQKQLAQQQNNPHPPDPRAKRAGRLTAVDHAPGARPRSVKGYRPYRSARTLRAARSRVAAVIEAKPKCFALPRRRRRQPGYQSGRCVAVGGSNPSGGLSPVRASANRPPAGCEADRRHQARSDAPGRMALPGCLLEAHLHPFAGGRPDSRRQRSHAASQRT